MSRARATQEIEYKGRTITRCYRLKTGGIGARTQGYICKEENLRTPKLIELKQKIDEIDRQKRQEKPISDQQEEARA